MCYCREIALVTKKSESELPVSPLEDFERKKNMIPKGEPIVNHYVVPLDLDRL